MSRRNMLVCSNCRHENEMDESHCTQCGAPLAIGSITIPVPLLADTDPLTEGLTPVEFTGPLVSKNAIALHIPGETQPIVLVDTDEIILGRHSRDNQPLTVDLTDYHAYTLGVSRHHAVINRTDEGYVLVDLGGANGTWLNRKRLTPHQPYPLQSGDMILLGQLSLYVSFPTEEDSAPSPAEPTDTTE